MSFEIENNKIPKEEKIDYIVTYPETPAINDGAGNWSVPTLGFPKRDVAKELTDSPPPKKITPKFSVGHSDLGLTTYTPFALATFTTRELSTISAKAGGLITYNTLKSYSLRQIDPKYMATKPLLSYTGNFTFTERVESVEVIDGGYSIKTFDTHGYTKGLLVTVSKCSYEALNGDYEVASIVGPREFTIAFPNPVPFDYVANMRVSYKPETAGASSESIGDIVELTAQDEPSENGLYVASDNTWRKLVVESQAGVVPDAFVKQMPTNLVGFPEGNIRKPLVAVKQEEVKDANGEHLYYENYYYSSASLFQQFGYSDGTEVTFDPTSAFNTNWTAESDYFIPGTFKVTRVDDLTFKVRTDVKVDPDTPDPVEPDYIPSRRQKHSFPNDKVSCVVKIKDGMIIRLLQDWTDGAEEKFYERGTYRVRQTVSEGIVTSCRFDLITHVYKWNGTENDNTIGYTQDIYAGLNGEPVNHIRNGYSDEEVAKYVDENNPLLTSFGEAVLTDGALYDSGEMVKWILGSDDVIVRGTTESRFVVSGMGLGDLGEPQNYTDLVDETDINAVMQKRAEIKAARKYAVWGLGSHLSQGAKSFVDKAPFLKNYPEIYNSPYGGNFYSGGLDNDMAGNKAPQIDGSHIRFSLSFEDTEGEVQPRPDIKFPLLTQESEWYVRANGPHNNITLDLTKPGVADTHSISINHVFTEKDIAVTAELSIPVSNLSADGIVVYDQGLFAVGDYITFRFGEVMDFPGWTGSDEVFKVETVSYVEGRAIIKIMRLDDSPVITDPPEGAFGLVTIYRLAYAPYTDIKVFNSLQQIATATPKVVMGVEKEKNKTAFFINPRTSWGSLDEDTLKSYLVKDDTNHTISIYLDATGNPVPSDTAGATAIIFSTVWTDINPATEETDWTSTMEMLESSILSNPAYTPKPIPPLARSLDLRSIFVANTTTEEETISFVDQNTSAHVRSKKTFVHLATPNTLKDGTECSIDISLPMVPTVKPYPFESLQSLAGYKNFVSQPRAYIISGARKISCDKRRLSSVTLVESTASDYTMNFVFSENHFFNSYQMYAGNDIYRDDEQIPLDGTLGIDGIMLSHVVSVGDSVFFDSTVIDPNESATTRYKLPAIAKNGVVSDEFRLERGVEYKVVSMDTGRIRIAPADGSYTIDIQRFGAKTLNETVDATQDDGRFSYMIVSRSIQVSFYGLGYKTMNRLVEAYPYTLDAMRITLPIEEDGIPDETKIITSNSYATYIVASDSIDGLTETENRELFSAMPEVEFSGDGKNGEYQQFTLASFQGGRHSEIVDDKRETVGDRRVLLATVYPSSTSTFGWNIAGNPRQGMLHWSMLAEDALLRSENGVVSLLAETYLKNRRVISEFPDIYCVLEPDKHIVNVNETRFRAIDDINEVPYDYPIDLTIIQTSDVPRSVVFDNRECQIAYSSNEDLWDLPADLCFVPYLTRIHRPLALDMFGTDEAYYENGSVVGQSKKAFIQLVKDLYMTRVGIGEVGKPYVLYTQNGHDTTPGADTSYMSGGILGVENEEYYRHYSEGKELDRIGYGTWGVRVPMIPYFVEHQSGDTFESARNVFENDDPAHFPGYQMYLQTTYFNNYQTDRSEDESFAESVNRQTSPVGVGAEFGWNVMSPLYKHAKSLSEGNSYIVPMTSLNTLKALSEAKRVPMSDVDDLIKMVSSGAPKEPISTVLFKDVLRTLWVEVAQITARPSLSSYGLIPSGSEPYWRPFTNLWLPSPLTPADFSDTVLYKENKANELALYDSIVTENNPFNELRSHLRSTVSETEFYNSMIVSIHQPEELYSTDFLRECVAPYQHMIPFYHYRSTRIAVDYTEAGYNNALQLENLRSFLSEVTYYAESVITEDGVSVYNEYLNDGLMISEEVHNKPTTPPVGKGVEVSDRNLSWVTVSDIDDVYNKASHKVSALGLMTFTSASDVMRKFKYSYTRVHIDLVFVAGIGRWLVKTYRQTPMSYLTPSFGAVALSQKLPSVLRNREPVPIVRNNENTIVAGTYPLDENGDEVLDYVWVDRMGLGSVMGTYKMLECIPYWEMQPKEINPSCVPWLSYHFPYDEYGMLIPYLVDEYDDKHTETYRLDRLGKPSEPIYYVNFDPEWQEALDAANETIALYHSLLEGPYEVPETLVGKIYATGYTPCIREMSNLLWEFNTSTARFSREKKVQATSDLKNSEYYKMLDASLAYYKAALEANEPAYVKAQETVTEINSMIKKVGRIDRTRGGIGFVVPNNASGGLVNPNPELTLSQPHMWSVYHHIRPCSVAMVGTDIPSPVDRVSGVMSDPSLGSIYEYPNARYPMYNIPWHENMGRDWLLSDFVAIDGPVSLTIEVVSVTGSAKQSVTATVVDDATGIVVGAPVIDISGTLPESATLDASPGETYTITFVSQNGLTAQSTYSVTVSGDTTKECALVFENKALEFTYMDGTEASGSFQGNTAAVYDIYLDDVLVASKQAGQVNSGTVTIPAGQHTMRIDDPTGNYAPGWHGKLVFGTSGPSQGIASRLYSVVNFPLIGYMSDATTLNTVTQIFQGATGLVSCVRIAVPEGTVTLPNGCFDRFFDGCTSLVEGPAIEIPTTVTTIPASCFAYMCQGCSAMETSEGLSLDHITKIEQQAFNGAYQFCTSLTQPPIITLSDTLTMDDVSGDVFRVTYAGCSSITADQSYFFIPNVAKLSEGLGLEDNWFWGGATLGSTAYSNTDGKRAHYMDGTEVTKGYAYA